MDKRSFKPHPHKIKLDKLKEDKTKKNKTKEDSNWFGIK